MQQVKQVFLAIALMLCGAIDSTAQTPDSLRADTVLLSVFNTGAKYRLTPATFAPITTGDELLTEMVLVQDTLVSFVETAGNGTTFLPPLLLDLMPDSTRQALENQKLMRPVITHQCDKPITADVKGKVVLMILGSCDAMVMCLNAQKAGAKAIVLIHPNNDRDSILLTSGVQMNKIKIPCYTVRRDIGARMSALLPSHVGIKKPDVMPDDAQALKAKANNGISMTNDVKNAGNTEGVSQSNSANVQGANTATSAKLNGKMQFTLSPNPANDVSTLTFNLSQATDLKLEVFNEAGQLMLRKSLQNAQTGSLDFDTKDWGSGAYFIHLTDGKGVKEVKRLVVQH